MALASLFLSEGDLVETGVFTGGASGLMMRALLQHDGCGRKLYVFDSFAGLPEPDFAGSDAGFGKNVVGFQPSDKAGGAFSATEEVFRENMGKMGALNEPSRLVVSKGWFSATCPTSPVKRIAFLRLDGDLYESTWDVLSSFYDRVILGGYIYVDDYFAFPGCMNAVDEFRLLNGITEPIRLVKIENPLEGWQVSPSRIEAVYWRKQTHRTGEQPNSRGRTVALSRQK
jgi:hypothetical protein